MSGYGPPGGPPPQPGGYGPPQPGGYGPPPGGGYGPPQPGGYGPPPGGGYGPPGYGAPRTGFNFGAVNPLDWGILGAALLAFIFSFIDFYGGGADASGGCPAGLQSEIDSRLEQLGQDTSATAWHGFFGWFGVILALVGALAVAITVFAPQVQLPVSARLVALGAFVLGALSIFIALFVSPVDLPPDQPTQFPGCTVSFVVKHGFGYWASLILVVGAAVLAYLRFTQTGGVLPGRGPARPGYGAPGYGAPAGYGPPPGYGQPQGPPPGYGQPQGPPPGYGQPQAPPPGYGAPQPQPAQHAAPPADLPPTGEVPLSKPAQPAPPEPPAQNEQAATQVVPIYPPAQPGQPGPQPGPGNPPSGG